MDLKFKLSRIILLLFVFLAIMHGIAFSYSLYWRTGWLDKVMHFLGGVWAVLVAIWLFYFSGKINIAKPSLILFLIIILGFVSLIGIFWEFSEFLYDQLIAVKWHLDLAQLGVADTMSDLFFDLLGGLMTALIFSKKYAER